MLNSKQRILLTCIEIIYTNDTMLFFTFIIFCAPQERILLSRKNVWLFFLNKKKETIIIIIINY